MVVITIRVCGNAGAYGVNLDILLEKGLIWSQSGNSANVREDFGRDKGVDL